jgi:hypothetical protein
MNALHKLNAATTSCNKNKTCQAFGFLVQRLLYTRKRVLFFVYSVCYFYIYFIQGDAFCFLYTAFTLYKDTRFVYARKRYNKCKTCEEQDVSSFGVSPLYQLNTLHQLNAATKARRVRV